MKLFSKTTACICTVIIVLSALTAMGVSAEQSTAPATSAVQTESGKVDKNSENVNTIPE